ncbi:MAG: TetR/AcrR family transcriptional regulator [Janthinobacterium lividum]
MAEQSHPVPAARKPRVDAQRNRDRILEVAREAFVRHGPDATLDDIARRAEIGPGTLYRHFPTRDDLLEAVFRSEVEKLTAAGERYAAAMTPLEGLRSWMLLFIDYVSRKLVILPALDTVTGGSTRLIEGSRALVFGTFRGLIERAVRSGDLRADTDPEDIIRALVGVFHTTALPDWEASARRIVDIVIDGSRPRP